ncbi:MAG: hypothetical protein VX938_00050, partial [Myxococcota bacterium]|nr:hypothetical protein [Myxococcota bacterium]
VFIGLYDHVGRLLPPEPDLVYVEAEGAVMTIPIEGAFGRYQLWTLIETLPGTTEGQLHVYASNDGRHLASFPFLRRPSGGWGADLGKSAVTFRTIDDLWGSGVTHEVVVRVRNPFDEVLGANAPVEVDVTEFGKLLGTHLDSDGSWVASVQAETGKGVIQADVSVEGVYLDTISIESNIPIPPSAPGDETTDDEPPADPPEDVPPTDQSSEEPRQDEADPEDTATVTEPVDGGGGCGLASSPIHGLGWLLALGIFPWLRGRRRWVL